uniref:Uncharacterized protein n=1 Tax=Timema shepardi TaxID=629360 RepID=A0A7R9AY84_TIMSH|nr:unnamed protein product [Timema shepardi]
MSHLIRKLGCIRALAQLDHVSRAGVPLDRATNTPPKTVPSLHTREATPARSVTSAVELNTTSALANYATEAGRNVDNTPEESGEVDRNVDNTPEESCEVDRNVDNTPEESCEADRNVDNTPEESGEADRNVDNTPEESCEADSNVDNTPEESCEADRNVDNTPEESGEADSNVDSTPEESGEADMNVDNTPEESCEADSNVDNTPEDSCEADSNVDNTPEESCESDRNVDNTPEESCESDRNVDNTPEESCRPTQQGKVGPTNPYIRPYTNCSVARDEVMHAVVLLVALLVAGVRGLCPPEGDILPCRCTMREEELQIWCSHSDLTKVLAGLQAVGGAVSRPVDELILENNYLPSLPGGAFSSLRVSRLMLRDNGLERVASSWLAGLEDSLLELFVVEPRLRSLPVDCLEQLRGLEAITIQGGAMKRIPRLSGLRRLRYVQIKSPSLVELSPHGFKSLPDLEQLHVVHSPHLTRLEAGLLQDMNRLRLVNISHCGLTWLHPRAMARLPVLTELALRGNR